MGEMLRRASCSGGCFSPDDNKRVYLASYFNAHMLSKPSWRYMYLLWFIIAAFAIFGAALHHLHLSKRTPYLAALWQKVGVRNRVIKIGEKEPSSKPRPVAEKVTQNAAARMLGRPAPEPSQQMRPPSRRRMIILPSVARCLFLCALLLIPILLTIIGADYIRPTAGIFDMSASFPNITDPGTPLFARSIGALDGIAEASQGPYRRHLSWGIGSFQNIGTAPATVTLPYRTWWTAGGRTGIMTNALTPLIVVVALKAQPFAIFSTRLLGGLSFDRLSFVHKWGGRIVWLFAAVHVATWSVQLKLDYAFGGDMWAFVFLWNRFRWGFVSFGFLTLLTLLSLGPLRRDYYEVFYACHIVCAAGTMIAAALHHPPLGAWMWAALAWWLAERAYRALKTAWTNGLGFSGRKPRPLQADRMSTTPTSAGWPQSPFPASAGPHEEKSWHIGGQPATQRQQFSSLGSLWGYESDSSANKIDSYSRSTAPRSEGSTTDGHGYRVRHNGSAGIDPPRRFSAATVSTFVGSEAPGKPIGDRNGSSSSEASGYGHWNETNRGSRGVITDYLPTQLKRQTPDSAQYDPVSDVVDDYSDADTDASRRQTLQGDVTPKERGVQLSDGHLVNQQYRPPFAPRNARPLSSADMYKQEAIDPPANAANVANARQGPAARWSATPMQASQSHFSHDSRGAAAQVTHPNSSSRPLLKRSARPAIAADVAAVIKPGFAFAQLLPGKTVRMTLRTPNRMWWRPGQYVNLNVPGVRWWESHPFTIASAYDAGAGAGLTHAPGEERTIVLLLRARHGFTRHLWDHVCAQREAQLIEAGAAAHKATAGVHIRALVDGPYGSSARVNWEENGTVLIICGGSGVSFGMSVLEHLCARMASAGTSKDSMPLTRVRFVWMLREFSHLQWIASALRRCIELVDPAYLRIDLYVTHLNNLETPSTRRPAARGPTAGILGEGSAYGTQSDGGNRMNNRSASAYGDGVPETPGFGYNRFTEASAGQGEEYDVSAYDLTQFDGEDFSAPSATEVRLNERLHKEGKLRRANTRKQSVRKAGRKAKQSPDVWAADITENSQRALYGQDSETEDLKPAAQERRQPESTPSSHHLLPHGPSYMTSGDGKLTPGTLTPSGALTPSAPPSPNLFPQSRPGLSSHRSSMLVTPMASTTNLIATAQGPAGGAGVDLEHGMVPPGTASFDAPIDLDPLEDADMRAVAELARPGHPRLDAIVREESERLVSARGMGYGSQSRSVQSLLVTSCGPGSLSSLLRSIVSRQIDPSGIRGGTAPYIDLVTESYEWGGS
ncbi:Ferric reductase, NADH/NADPH oxidase and related proteins [Ceraceosorus bombacis]|uniref:ferric-chelate reductase (NADPH) n=1 Tax=Ceraceosorus bombacis TaxID=401625 RepID=A0A0P1BNF8_9BASI|nr:Ferric reductase, NADH/NADPH oxidase and related proteins [Ceraceosorus bombacis]